MALLDHDSEIGVNAELELFEQKPTNTSILKYRIEEINPLVSIAQSETLEFLINAGESEYVDMSLTTLYLRCKIVDSNGDALDEKKADGTDNDDAKVFPVNYLIGSLFSQCEVFLNNKQVGASSSLYPYRAYLETLLNYTKDVKDHQLAASGYYKDSGEGLMDTTADAVFAGTSANKGAVKRFKWVKYSKVFELEGKLHNEISNQHKLVLNKVPIYVRLLKSRPAFCLMSKVAAKEYKIVVEKAVLKAMIKTGADYVRDSLTQRLSHTNTKYPLTRIETKFYVRAAGLSDLSEPNIVSGSELPRRVIIGLVSSKAFNGSLSENPFNFQHFKASNIKLRVNGQDSPYGELKLDFTDNRVLEGYMTLFRGSNLWGTNRSNDIKIDDFKNGHALYAFNLTPDNCNGCSYQLAKTGTLSLEIRLKEATTIGVTLLCYMEFDSFLEINSDRQVFYNENFAA